MRNQPIRRAFGLNFGGSFAKRERFGLGKNIRQQYVVMTAQRGERVTKRNEITWDQPGPLVNQLIEGMLTVGSWFAPIDGTRIIVHDPPIQSHMFAVALHGQLLQVGGKALQVLLEIGRASCRERV